MGLCAECGAPLSGPRCGRCGAEATPEATAPAAESAPVDPRFWRRASWWTAGHFVVAVAFVASARGASATAGVALGLGMAAGGAAVAWCLWRRQAAWLAGFQAAMALVALVNVATAAARALGALAWLWRWLPSAAAVYGVALWTVAYALALRPPRAR